MARRVRDINLESRSARGTLRARGKPYWHSIESGLHLGYRRLKGAAGRWCVRYYVGGAKGYDVETIASVDDLSDADGVAILSFWQAQKLVRERMVERARSAAGIAGPLIVSEVMADYIRYLQTSRKPVRTADSHDKVHIEPRLGSVEVQNLTTKMIEKFRDEVAAEQAHVGTAGGKPQRFKQVDEDFDDDELARRREATTNRLLTTLKAALNRSWRDGKISSDQAWRRVQPFHGVDSARIRYLEIAESKRLINACEADFRKLVQGVLVTGARYQQLSRTIASDFNTDAGTLRLTTRKGRGKLKTFFAVLSDEGIEFFKQACFGLARKDRIFLRGDGGAWDESDQTRPMLQACEAAKINPPIGIHGLRHTWASHAVMNGVPLLVVAKNLGHSDTRMVEKHYGHLSPSYIVDAIRAGAPKFGIKTDKTIASMSDRRAT